jgi:xylose isomerase
MNAFEPGPLHKFAFGLRTIPPAGRDSLGGEYPEPIEPWEFVYQLGDIGAWGVAFRDDDLVPVAASTAERDDILDKFTKALDSTGMVVSMARTDLSDHPVFEHGAFTSVDRDVRRYAIQKAMRAVDLGAELGAQLHDLPAAGEGLESIAAGCPLDALERYREAVDFLCGYVREQRYPTRFAVPCELHAPHGDSLLSTVGHALAFISTLDQPELVGLDPVVTQRTDAGPLAGLAQALDASKLFHVELDAHPNGHHGPPRVSDGFFVVKLLQDAGYDGPLHFAVDPDHDSADLWEFALGCMRTHRTLASKAQRFADDPEIRDAVAQCGGLELREPSVGAFSPESARALSIECFDPAALSQRRYRSQRLDQLVVDLVLGLR